MTETVTDPAYDVLVIGSGEAGKYLAWALAGEGHRTAVVERPQKSADSR